MVTTPVNRAEHEFVNVPVLAAYRRETGLENLVAYRHRVHGRWVLALLSHDARDMIEVGYVDGTQEGNSFVPSRPAFQRMVRTLKTLWKDADECKRAVRAEARRHADEAAEFRESFDDARLRMATFLQRTKGPKKAEEYLHNCGLGSRASRVLGAF